MLTKLAKPSSRVPTGLYGTLFAVLISLLAAGGVLGGFLLGRNSTRDAFIERVGAARGSDGVTLISAGSAPLSLLEVLGERIDDELTAHALAKIYGVAADDRDQLIQRLDKVVWLPPFRPAPFVGHAARPFFSDDLRINVLGFRDER